MPERDHVAHRASNRKQTLNRKHLPTSVIKQRDERIVIMFSNMV
jgi:hypothetical protein